MKTAATNDRNYRTFLLVAQLEAKAIGQRIAQARAEAGLTQEQVGDLATFSKRSLQDYETGVTIPYKHMRELSEILEREVAWFLHGEPEAHAPAPESVLGLLQELREGVDASAEATADALEALARGIERIERRLDAGVDLTRRAAR